MQFSVIIPVYNVEKYLKEAVGSVINQSFHDYEIILVDDGSTDSSSSICDELKKIYRNIKLLHKPNGGLSDARNVGLSVASGEYVIFLDSDDYWNDVDFLSKADKIVTKSQPDVMVFGYKKVVGKKVLASYQPSSNSKTIDELVKASEFNICAWDKIIKRELLVENGICFRKNVYSEDMEWCALIFKYAEKVEVFKETPYVYRQREGSITKQLSEKNISDVKNNFEICIDLMDGLSQSKKEIYEYYLSKNFSMFMIALSQLDRNRKKKYYSFIKKNVGYLRKYSRNRERIIYLATKLLGVSLTEKLLSVVYVLKG